MSRNPNQNDRFTSKDVTVNLQPMECCINGRTLNLTRNETRLLLHLIDNKACMLTRQAIAAHPWGEYTDSLDSAAFVYQHINNLRKKIADAGEQSYLSTVYGLGDKLDSASR